VGTADTTILDLRASRAEHRNRGVHIANVYAEVIEPGRPVVIDRLQLYERIFADLYVDESDLSGIIGNSKSLWKTERLGVLGQGSIEIRYGDTNVIDAYDVLIAALGDCHLDS